MGTKRNTKEQVEQQEKQALEGYQRTIKATFRRGVYVGIGGTIAIVALATLVSLVSTN